MANPKNHKNEKTNKKTERSNPKNNELLIENAASYISRGSRATEEEQQRKFQKHELNNLEAILAYDFAIENKLWFADINVFGNPFPGGGNENELYYNEETGTIFKVNNLFNNELSISSFLKYIQYHNTLFETNAYTLIGFTGFSNNVHHIKGAIPYVAPIVAQKYVPNSENATIPEVHKHMELLGFEKVNDHTYKNKEYIVSDLWERNVLKDKEGNIHIVDNMIKKINTKKMSRGGKLVGASHAEGGIDIITPNGQIEAEGGEIIITKKASEEHCETLSKINQSGGGIAIPCDNNSKQPKKAANGAIISHLSGEHKEAMIMANKLLTSGTVEENAGIVVKEWRSHLLPHFKEEESQIYKVRMDADSKHFIAEHKKIKQLVEKIAADPKEKDINQFAEMLIHHINEEEEYFKKTDSGGQIKTHAQYKSVILETVGKNHYLHINNEGWKLTNQQLIELNKELESFHTPLGAANFLIKKDKQLYQKVTMENNNLNQDIEITNGSIVTVKGKEGDYSVISHSGDDYTIKRIGFMKYDDYKGSFNAKLSDLTIVQKAKEGMKIPNLNKGDRVVLASDPKGVKGTIQNGVMVGGTMKSYIVKFDGHDTPEHLNPDEVMLAPEEAKVDGTVFYTSATENYDGFGSKTISTTSWLDRNEKPVRKVFIPNTNIEWQTQRYNSGNFAAYSESDFKRVVANPNTMFHQDKSQLSWNAQSVLQSIQRAYPESWTYNTTTKNDQKTGANELEEKEFVKRGYYDKTTGFQEVLLREEHIPFDKKYKLQPWLKAGEYYDVERLDLKGNPEGRKDKHVLLKYVDHTGLGPNGNEWGLYFTTEHSSFFIPYSKLDHYLLNNWIVQSTAPLAMEKPKETPKKEVVKEKTANDIVQELSEGKLQTPINSSVVNNWDKVPAAWRNIREIKEIKYINSPYDKGLLSIVKPFFGTDPLNPKFSGINFDDAGITVTDGAKLIHLPYPNAKYKANYATGPAIKSTIDPPKNDIFTGSAYPNYPAVIPYSGKEENHVYEFDAYKVIQYSKAALKYANKATKQAAFKYGEQIIGFNTEFLIEIMEAALKLGHEKLYATFRKPNNAVVFSPDKNYAVGKSEILLVMPVMLWADKGETPELGSRDLDFARQLNAYFDFTDNEIHNADGSVAKFQMNYGDDSVLDANTLTLLEKFRKSVSNSVLSHILEHFIVKGDKIFASTMETEVLVQNTNSLLTDGAYDIINGAIEFNAFFPAEDYPQQTQPDNQDYKFVISASILKYYLDKAFDYLGNDDLRPQMNGYSIQYVGGKMFIYATNAHILFKADITRYAEVNKNQVDFAVILNEPNIIEFLDYAGEDAIVFKANKLYTTIECTTGKFTSKNINAKYPNAEAILPKGNNKSLTINIKDLYNCLKGEEAVKFIKENKKGNTINIYDKKSGSPDVLDIYLGYSAQEGGVWKLQKEVKICSVAFKYSESEKPLINTGSLLLIMPVMRDGESSAEGYFAFGEKFFHQILDTCSSEEITLEFLAPNRAYVIPGEDFDFSKTVAAKKAPKPLPLTPKQEWQNAINTLKQDGGPDSVEAIETLEMLLKEKYEEGGMIGKDEYKQLLREYDKTGAFLEDTEDSGDMNERSRLKARLSEIESKIHRYERSYKEGGSIFSGIEERIKEVENDARKMSINQKEKTFVLDYLNATSLHEKITWGVAEDIKYMKSINRFDDTRVISMFENGVQVFETGGPIPTDDYIEFKKWYNDYKNKYHAKLINERKTFMGAGTIQFGPAVFSIIGKEPFEKIYPSNYEAEFFADRVLNLDKMENGGEIKFTPIQTPIY